MLHPMWDGCRLIWSLLIGLFRSRATREAENMVLRQQIIVLRRTAHDRQARDCRSVASGGVQSPIGAGNRGGAGEDQRSRLRSGS